jgi:hypothetical protein
MNPHLWNGEAGRLFAPVILLGVVALALQLPNARLKLLASGYQLRNYLLECRIIRLELGKALREIGLFGILRRRDLCRSIACNVVMCLCHKRDVLLCGVMPNAKLTDRLAATPKPYEKEKPQDRQTRSQTETREAGSCPARG